VTYWRGLLFWFCGLLHDIWRFSRASVHLVFGVMLFFSGFSTLFWVLSSRFLFPFFFFSCGFFLSGFVFSFNCQMVPSWEPEWASTTTARMLITTYYGCWLEGWVGFDRGDDAWRLRASMRGDICI